MGDAVDFGYYQYQDAFGNTWSVKVDKTWGANPDSGFVPGDPGDPVMVPSPALRPRRIFLQDPTSTRITSRVVATTTATAWSSTAYSTTVNFRGLAAGVLCAKIDQRDEHIRKLKYITSKPEPV